MAKQRYVVAIGGRFYWQVPKRFRVPVLDHLGRPVEVDGEPTFWPQGTPALPDDPAERAAKAAELNAELDARRSGATPDTRKGSMPWLIAQYEASSYYSELSDNTKRAYLHLSRHVLAWSAKRNHPPITALTKPKVLDFLAPFDDRRALRDHLVQYLGVVLEYACRIGLIQHHPARRLGFKKAKRSKPIRIVEVAQMLSIVAKAHEMGLPHVAMGVLLHFDLGQRQGDVLRLRNHIDYRGGVFQFDQSKTDQTVTIKPFLAETRAALAAVPPAQFALVADGRGLLVKPDRYKRDFRKVADAAGFHDLWEMELRHSCVIFCERAGLTPGEIATRTGHSLETVIQILERYRYRDSVVAAQGAVKLEDYRNKTATKV